MGGARGSRRDQDAEEVKDPDEAERCQEHGTLGCPYDDCRVDRHGLGDEGGADPQELLHSLRWDVDSLITNAFGERVWLKPCLDENEDRIGITECCFEAAPCTYHAVVAARIKKNSES